MKEVSVFGLGKVGLTLAACLSEAGLRVVGVDVDERHVDALQRGDLSSPEPGVADRVRRWTGRRLSFTLSAEQAVECSSLSFVIVPTPSNTQHGFSLRYVQAAVKRIGAALRRKSGRHVLAVMSTMLPGSSDLMIIPLLEEASGRTLGSNLGYCYNPAFIALGEVVQGLVRPDYLLIGQSDEQAGSELLEVHQAMLANGAPIARMSPAEAEIAKIASNTHETMRVAFANMLFSLATELPGVNVDRITSALAHRIGKRFFRGATPYGGPCWPRDNRALAVVMDAVGVPSAMPRMVDVSNEEHARYILRKVLEVTRRDQNVGLLGLAYKPGTCVVEQSFGIDLANWLVAEGRRVIGWDPLAMSAARGVLPSDVALVDSAQECIRRSEVIMILLPLAELATLNWGTVGDRLVLDCWRCLRPEDVGKLAHYRALGCGPTENGRSLLNIMQIDRLRLLTE